MGRLSILLAALVLPLAVHAAIVPRGVPIDPRDPGERVIPAALFGEGAAALGRRQMRIDGRGFLTLARDAPVGWVPGPLAELVGPDRVAVFWAPRDPSRCGPEGTSYAVERLDEPAQHVVTITWIEVPPAGCALAEAERARFAVTIAGHDDGGVSFTFRYGQLPGASEAGAPRAGVGIGAAQLELLPDGEGQPSDRAKALLDGRSERDPAAEAALSEEQLAELRGVWVIEIGPDGLVAGDPDHDGIRAGDNCVGVANPLQADVDHDDSGDACDPDVDGDGVFNDEVPLDRRDNCPLTPNPDQRDTDEDGDGDACDDDDDDDGWPDTHDRCPRVADVFNLDLDGDGLGDACDPDIDGDDRRSPFIVGSWSSVDLCPYIHEVIRTDRDGDGLGDRCDLDDEHSCKGLGCLVERDRDGDGRSDLLDACPTAFDPVVIDTDRDGIGDACDPDRDGDGRLDLDRIR